MDFAPFAVYLRSLNWALLLLARKKGEKCVTNPLTYPSPLSSETGLHRKWSLLFRHLEEDQPAFAATLLVSLKDRASVANKCPQNLLNNQKQNNGVSVTANNQLKPSEIRITVIPGKFGK